LRPLRLKFLPRSTQVYGSSWGRAKQDKVRGIAGVNSRYWEKDEDIKPRLSERVISFFIGKYVKIRYKMWMFRKEANESELNLQDLSDFATCIGF
jgi:hypothetical protein